MGNSSFRKKSIEEIKSLCFIGADFCHQRTSTIPSEDQPFTSLINDYLANRSLLIYHPLASNGQICLDISNCFSQINGRLINASCYRLSSFSQSLLNLGGCSILYPIIGFFKENDYDHSDENKYSNPIASIISLFESLLFSSANILFNEQLTKHFNIEILAEYFHQLSSNFLDEQFIISLEQLVDTIRSIHFFNTLTTQFIEHILLDFNLWNKSIYPVRVLHLQYVFKILKEERRAIREKFGVQFFLDILKQYFK